MWVHNLCKLSSTDAVEVQLHSLMLCHRLTDSSYNMTFGIFSYNIGFGFVQSVESDILKTVHNYLFQGTMKYICMCNMAVVLNFLNSSFRSLHNVISC